MERVRIVVQGVYRQNSIFDATNNNPHIALIVMCCFQQPVPIKGGRRNPCVYKQDRAQYNICVRLRLPYFVCWLQVNLFDRVFGIGLILVRINAATNFDGRCASQNAGRYRLQHVTTNLQCTELAGSSSLSVQGMR